MNHALRRSLPSLLGGLLLVPLHIPPIATAQQSSAIVYDTTLYAGMQYRMIGPYRGGRSTAVTGVRGEPHTFFMGGTGGGVWKSDDAGQHWFNLTDDYFNVGSIGAVTVADSDPNVVYVGTGSACIRGNVSTGRGLWKSLDGGDTWTFIGLPEAGAIGDVVVHPTNPDLVYVAALGHPFGKNPERGVYRSTDGGASWEQVLFANDSTGAVDLVINPRNPRELYAGMWRAERKPWTLISGGAEGGVYKTVDGGDTWQKLTGGLPGGIVGKVGVTVSPANPNRVWALLEAEPDGGVYRSDDRGRTWTRVNSENKLRQRAWYYTHIEADPRDENTVYVLNTRFYRSVDGGKTFEQTDVPHGDVHDVWVNPDNPRIIVVGDDGGAQVSLNNGDDFSTYFNQPTAEFYDVVVDNGFPYRVYGSQQDNTTIGVPAWGSTTSLHPKQNWQYASGCETGPVALHPDYPEVIWGGCYGGAINRWDVSKDQRRNMVIYPQLQLGQAARDMRYRFQWVSPIVVSPHDRNVVYHASQMVHRTTDGGMSWETISPDLTTDTPAHQDYSGGPINHDITGVEIYNTIFSLVVSPHDPATLWAGSDDGRVHVTRDDGGTWTEITPDRMPALGTVNRIEVSPHRAGRAFLAVQRYRLDDFRPYVFRTNDYGRSWTLLTDGRNGIPDNHPVRVVREDPTREGLLYAGTEFGIFASFDDGAHWQTLQLNLPVTPVTDIKVHRGDLVLSTQGRSFWILDDLTPLREMSPEVAATTAYLYTPRDVYRFDRAGGEGLNGDYNPDPLPNGAMIHYVLGQDAAAEVTLEILDGTGASVRTFSSDSAAAAVARLPQLPDSAGMHRVVWDLTYPGPDSLVGQVIWGYRGGVKAPPGTYQARLSANGVTQTRSFQVLKDPRLTDVTQADFEAQFRLANQVRDSMNAVNGAIQTIRAVKQQATSVVERAEDAGHETGRLPVLQDTLSTKLTGVEVELTQVNSQSGQDPIRFAGQLDNQYTELYGNVTGRDGYISGGPEGRPTVGASARLEDLNDEWMALKLQLDVIIRTDLAAFNDELRRLGIPGVMVPVERELVP